MKIEDRIVEWLKNTPEELDRESMVQLPHMNFINQYQAGFTVDGAEYDFQQKFPHFKHEDSIIEMLDFLRLLALRGVMQVKEDREV